mmetsp:Transcript_21109/g.37566  ORF Transcript_21109/g.37566 Transcript_21109/m.37566 type:complete len:210 (-) Transcript_21109:1-630(-)
MPRLRQRRGRLRRSFSVWQGRRIAFSAIARACLAEKKKKAVRQPVKLGDERVRIQVVDAYLWSPAHDLSSGADEKRPSRTPNWRVVLVLELWGQKRVIPIYDAKHPTTSIPKTSNVSSTVDFILPSSKLKNNAEISVTAYYSEAGQSKSQAGLTDEATEWKSFCREVGSGELDIANVKATGESDVAKHAKRFTNDLFGRCKKLKLSEGG